MDRCDILPNDCGSDDVAFAKDLSCVVVRGCRIGGLLLVLLFFSIVPLPDGYGRIDGEGCREV